jgi:hypothetical protein
MGLFDWITFDILDVALKGRSELFSSEASFENAILTKTALEQNGIKATATLGGLVLISPKDKEKAARLLKK